MPTTKKSKPLSEPTTMLTNASESRFENLSLLIAFATMASALNSEAYLSILARVAVRETGDYSDLHLSDLEKAERRRAASVDATKSILETLEAAGVFK